MQNNPANPTNPFSTGGVPQDDVVSTPPISPIANVPTNGDSTPPEPTTPSTPVSSGGDGGIGSAPKRRGPGAKVIATVFGLVLLVGGVGAGLLLVQQQQILNQGAAGGYISGGGGSPVCVHAGTYQIQRCNCPTNTSPGYPGCVCSQNCTISTVTATEGQCFSATAPACGSNQVDIAGQGTCAGSGLCVKLKCTAVLTGAAPNQVLQIGQKVNLKVNVDNISTNDNQNLSRIKRLVITSNNTSAITVAPPTITGTNGGFVSQGLHNLVATAVAAGKANIRVRVDMVNCPTCGTTSGVCNVVLPLQVAGPTASPTPTATPTTPPVAPQCTGIKMYDDSFTEIPQNEWSSLDPGTVIKFAVTGTTVSGNFDKAEFFVNGTSIGISTTTVPSNSAEFYIDYTIPAGTTTFNVGALLHHLQLDQWF